MKWRDRKYNHWLYYPVKPLIMYTSALLSLAWGTILMSYAGIPFKDIEVFDSTVFVFVVTRAILVRIENITRDATM
jgi:hypothetical protein